MASTSRITKTGVANALLAAAPAPFGMVLPLVFQVEQQYLGQSGMGRVKRQRARALRQRVPQPA
jgi:hypothetical protein